jgi:outer membrane immunogenic protein
MKWKVLIGAMLATTLGGGAWAADLNAPPPVYNGAPIGPVNMWQGFYLGANGGFGWGRSCWGFVDTIPSGLAGPPTAEGCHNPNGGIVGGQLGYNWQIDHWVLGIDLQGDWAALQGQNVSLLFPTTFNRTRIDGLGLLTGRIGYAAGSALIYAKGGAAIVDSNYDFFGTLFGGPASGSAHQVQAGATVGAGIEYKFAQCWSVAIEYDYVNLANAQLTFATSLGVGAYINTTQNLNLVTARVNYAF